MLLYLDDDITSHILVRLLTAAGHDVVIPAQVGTTGVKDPAHLTAAIRQGRSLLSQNYKDFEGLHDLVIASGGGHPGVLMVRKDNNPKRDMTEAQIVSAIRKLLAAQAPVANEYITLNQWR